ncbi:MAG TPA: HAD-IA family hydrolase [Phycisphaerae bacterium]|nr:HAD-IA family hydrolase [Phycisphaerae bacterium]
MSVRTDHFPSALAENANVNIEIARQAINTSLDYNVDERINRGEMTMQNYFDSHLKGLGKLNYCGFEKAWKQIVGEDFPEIKQAYHDLRVPLYILSNINDVHTQVLKQHWLNDIAVQFWASYEIGLIKPAHEVYEFALKNIDCKPEEILFFDDLIPNIATSLEMGINATLFTCPADVINKFKKYELI